MKIFDFLFKDKKEEQEEEKTIQKLGNQKINVEENVINPCAYCNFTIEQHQKRKKYGGKKFHRKCFKKALKQARKQTFG